MSKPREFDLYFSVDPDGKISPYESHICENYEPWTETSPWAKPDAHVIEKSHADKLEAALIIARSALEALNEETHHCSCQDNYAEVYRDLSCPYHGAKEHIAQIDEALGSESGEK